MNLIKSDNSTFIITSPEKFGKSTILTMIRNFFELALDNEGKMLAENPNRVLFEGGFVLNNQDINIRLKAQKITLDSEWESLFSSRLGQNPVIFISIENYII
jgi:hypothetical protein